MDGKMCVVLVGMAVERLLMLILSLVLLVLLKLLLLSPTTLFKPLLGALSFFNGDTKDDGDDESSPTSPKHKQKLAHQFHNQKKTSTPYLQPPCKQTTINSPENPHLYYY